MKTLLCILLFSAAAFGQMADAERQDRREKPGCERIQPFPGVLLAPSDDQTILGAHWLILDNGALGQLKLFGGFQENHSPFAQAADFYTHADAGFRAPVINFYKSRGTQFAPTAVTFTGYELDSMGGINFGGYDGSSYAVGAAIYSDNDENWTPTAHGGHLSIYGTFSGVLNQKQIMQFGGKDPSGIGSPNGNIISYRPISFGGNTASSPAFYYTLNPPSIKIRTADDSRDAPLVTAPHTPATAFDACVAGTIAWDQNFVYVCIATNTWRRSALAAW